MQLAVRKGSAVAQFAAALHYNPKQEIEKLQSLSSNDRTTDAFQIFVLDSLKMDVSGYYEVWPAN